MDYYIAPDFRGLDADTDYKALAGQDPVWVPPPPEPRQHSASRRDFIKGVEEVVKGGKQDDETAALAGRTAVHGARPVNYNQFKVPLMESLVKRAIRDAV
jgi:hypothetical protein